MKHIISKDYQAREVTGGKIVDFGYEESIQGWDQGFQFVKENNAEWVLNEVSNIALRDDEYMVILSAGLRIKGEMLDTANLFFDTFKREDGGNWKMIRSYTEAGIPLAKLKEFTF